MIWLNPWAWLGLIGVALPVLIHLLGRGHARVQKFPTLRFLDASRLMPTQRTRIHDVALLLVRLAIVAAAVAALAQPIWLTTGRKQSLDRGLARAIVLDTSASMRRATPSGQRAIDSAMTLSRALAAEARTSVVVSTADPAHALSAAGHWVARQQRRGEIVVISDFQRGEIERSDFASLPATIGLSMHRVPVVDTTHGSNVLTWNDVAAIRPDPELVVTLAADSDAAGLAAARAAANIERVAPPFDTTRAVAIVYRRYGARDKLAAGIAPIRAPWMGDLVARLVPDSIPIESFGQETIDGRLRLVLFTSADPGSLASARLIAAANQSLSAAPPPSELEPETFDDATLLTWERTPTDAPQQLHPRDDNGPSDARWLWALALALLVVEMRLRRLPVAIAATVEAPARAA